MAFGGMKLSLFVVLLLMLVTVDQGEAVLCFLCDSFEGNCVGASCEGSACLKRVAFVDGLLRVSKMCVLSGEEVMIEQCSQVALWQGRFGTECICQSDWCNAVPSLSSGVHFLAGFIVVYAVFNG
ncbi:hypothetical protein L596_027032 [Steinernema carpocapsae]|uniref:Protein quiver n=1 Tax=Steinernema carpocapsae TaxID=34508 RepID=A0A4U5M372_STECR|nr:hypothetical protein L596_027032 [Steinernema carpocapsae]